MGTLEKSSFVKCFVINYELIGGSAAWKWNKWCNWFGWNSNRINKDDSIDWKIPIPKLKE